MKGIELPYPTSFTNSGPEVTFTNSDLTIKYDYVDDNKVVHWVTIIFEFVYGFNYIECDYTNTSNYKFGLVQIVGSDWIKRLENVWSQEYERDLKNIFGGELDKVKHFRIYFDDHGMYDIICKGILIAEK